MDKTNITPDTMGNYEAIETQIRDCFARVAWTHKTHEKQADIYRFYASALFYTKILITGLATTGGILSIFNESSFYKYATAVTTSLLLAIDLIFSNRNFEDLSTKHHQTALDIWNVRESYISLLTAIRAKDSSVNEIKQRRDNLQYQLAEIYKKAPRSSRWAYKLATKALHGGELNFTNNEIDHLLPPQLHCQS